MVVRSTKDGLYGLIVTEASDILNYVLILALILQWKGPGFDPPSR